MQVRISGMMDHMQDKNISVSGIKNAISICIKKVKMLVKDADINSIICPINKRDFSSRNEDAKKCTVKSGCCLKLSNFL